MRTKIIPGNRINAMQHRSSKGKVVDHVPAGNRAARRLEKALRKAKGK